MIGKDKFTKIGKGIYKEIIDTYQREEITLEAAIETEYAKRGLTDGTLRVYRDRYRRYLNKVLFIPKEQIRVRGINKLQRDDVKRNVPIFNVIIDKLWGVYPNLKKMTKVLKASKDISDATAIYYAREYRRYMDEMLRKV